jgi:di/tricarboxylate transporter
VRDHPNPARTVLVGLAAMALRLLAGWLLHPITNAAAASILTPVALGIATKLGLDPVTLLALVATCISFTFINPFSHQTNLMVMGPGAYSTRTFAKFGAPSWPFRWPQ